jgi:hypothetical protein
MGAPKARGAAAEEALAPHLNVTVELREGVEPPDSLAQDLAAAVERHVCRTNSEFSRYVPAERRRPSLHLMPNGDPDCFPRGVKPRYTRH